MIFYIFPYVLVFIYSFEMICEAFIEKSIKI